MCGEEGGGDGACEGVVRVEGSEDKRRGERMYFYGGVHCLDDY